MPNTRQGSKRVRQDEERRLQNKATKSAVRGQVRKFREAVAAGDADVAGKELQAVFSRLDKAAKTNVMHKNTADRKKSRLNKMLAGLSAGQ